LLETNKYDVLIVLSDGSIPLVLSKKLFLHVQQPLEEVQTASIKNKFKLSRVSAIFYNSHFTKSFNNSLLKGVKTEIIYPPVELSPKKVKKENIILHVGRFRVNNVSGVEDYKKQSVMVDAFKQMIDEKLKDWKFVIAASVKKEDEETFALLQQAAKGYPIEFLLNKTNDALWDMYNKAKIYWHASGFGEDLEKHPEYAEHFGISTVEAMGAGAVPVVINAGGQKEIVKDGENGFLWNTLDELQEKTKVLVEDQSLWATMSEQAKERAKNFSKEKFAQAIESLILS
jgi:glycosyltransferase involved in cell wall biosynthesis